MLLKTPLAKKNGRNLFELSDLGRLWRTVRHLRPVQIIYRVIFRLRKPRADIRPAPQLGRPNSEWHHPGTRRPVMTGPSQFMIFGSSHNVSQEGWNPNHLSKLICYNLHYFNDLNAVKNLERLDWHCNLINKWIAENPAPVGNGWEPYPISLRIVNWVKWAQLNPDKVSADMINSLALQTRFLENRLEWHLLGNHLFVNAKALIFVGLFFQGAEAERWRKTGFSILNRQIPEQILPDGGHFELSPMYHALAVEDILDLINITIRYSDSLTPLQADAARKWNDLIGLMLGWLAAASHPDDRVSFFNDTAFGIALENEELRNYASRLGLKATAQIAKPYHPLPNSGYYRLSRGPAVVIADLAAVGPGYLPAHAHADTFSFELSLYMQRVIVNGGTSMYGAGVERQRQRSTAAHSTLCLDGKNSSEVWGGFRVGRRAQVLKKRIFSETKATILEASHDGYHHLHGKPTHQRQWLLSEQKLEVSDRITGQGEHKVQIYFHLHPNILTDTREGQTIKLYTQSQQLLAYLSVSEGAYTTITSSNWHPEFGVSVPTQTICVTQSGSKNILITTSFEWDNDVVSHFAF